MNKNNKDNKDNIVDPLIEEQERYGIKGGIKFDKAKPNTDVRIYQDLMNFIKSIQGLGGSGGVVGKRQIGSDNFAQINVFSAPSTRDKVKRRLERQLTQYLEEKYADKAEALNMTIPEFLKSQGISGLKEIPRGKKRKYTFYEDSDLIETVQNPLTGSNEKLLKAFLNKTGSVTEIFGGINEGRRLRTYVTPDEASYIRSKTEQTAEALNLGSYNKADLEAIYGTQDQRLKAKFRKNEAKNLLIADLMNDKNSPAAGAVRSEILKQRSKKLLLEQLTEEMGLNGKDERKDERQGALKTGKGTALLAAVVITTAILGTIKALISSMLSVLKKISVDMGKLIQDSAELGLDPELLDRMRRWGLANPTYTGNNEFLLIDALKEYNNRFGNILRLDANKDFDSLAYNKYHKLITTVVQSSIKEDPYGGLSEVFNTLARAYLESGKSAQELRRQAIALTDTFKGSVSTAYIALIKSAEANGLLSEKTVGNFLESNLNPNYIDRLSMGVHVDQLTGGSADVVGVEGNAEVMNDLLGDMNKIQNALYMMLVQNLDAIIQLLFGIARAILKIANFYDVEGAKEALQGLDTTERRMAEMGTRNLMINTQKFYQDAENLITGELKKQGYKDEGLKKAREDIISTILAKAPLDEKYSFLQKNSAIFSQVLDDLAAYEEGARQTNESLLAAKKGSFTTTGIGFNLFTAGERNAFREAYGIVGYPARYTNVSRALGLNVSQDFLTDMNAAFKSPIRTSFDLISPQTIIYRREPTVETPDNFFEKRRVNPERLQEQTNQFIRNLVPFKRTKSLEKSTGFLLPDETFNYLAPISPITPLISKGGVSNEPFEVINRVEIMVNDKLVSSNVGTLAEENKRRYFNNSANVTMG